MKTSAHIRVRFAPSPTGHLHLGGARSAIFNWLLAQHSDGEYFLRIEDTDILRSSELFVESQMQSLAWLGLSPKEPAVRQMARQSEHVAAAYSLMQKGRAYPCFCIPRDADEVIKNLDHGVGSKYAGTCRNRVYTNDDLKLPHAIRFKIPDNCDSISFHDLILGPMKIDRDQLDDYVIIRRDGTPIYNFCVVIDDIFMNITHVVRGQDHISNTPKQLLYYDALGVQPPQFAHIPLILGPSGAKLSKRDAAVSVEEYRLKGYLPDALFNYLVRLGWSHGDQEIFTKNELIKYFTLDHVGKKGSIFDVKKLQWLNGFYIRNTIAELLYNQIITINKEYKTTLDNLWPIESLYTLIDLFKQRASTLLEIYDGIVNFAQAPINIDTDLLSQCNTDKTPIIVYDFIKELEESTEWTVDTIKCKAQEIGKKYDTKLVALAQPLRLALTGSLISPGIFELINVLGKTLSINRINALLKCLDA